MTETNTNASADETPDLEKQLAAQEAALKATRDALAKRKAEQLAAKAADITAKVKAMIADLDIITVEDATSIRALLGQLVQVAKPATLQQHQKKDDADRHRVNGARFLEDGTYHPYWYDHRTKELRRMPDGVNLQASFVKYDSVDDMPAALAKCRKNAAKVDKRPWFIPDCFAKVDEAD